MLISIFKDLTFVTGVDYSFKQGTPDIPDIPGSLEIQEVRGEDGEIITPYQAVIEPIYGMKGIPDRGNIDCISCVDVDFDPVTQDLKIEKKGEEYEIIIINKSVFEESDSEKLTRISSLLISSNDYESIDTKGVSGFNVDQMILSRFFHGDRGAEIGYTQKLIFNPTDPDLIDLYEKKEKFKSFITSLNS